MISVNNVTTTPELCLQSDRQWNGPNPIGQSGGLEEGGQELEAASQNESERGKTGWAKINSFRPWSCFFTAKLSNEMNLWKACFVIQCDHSGRVKPPVDNKT